MCVTTMIRMRVTRSKPSRRSKDPFTDPIARFDITGFVRSGVLFACGKPSEGEADHPWIEALHDSIIPLTISRGGGYI